MHLKRFILVSVKIHHYLIQPAGCATTCERSVQRIPLSNCQIGESNMYY
jgi:hypothetical protein